MNTYLPEGRLMETMTNINSVSSESGLKNAMAEGKILEWRAAVCDAEHNLVVEMPGGRGIIPKEEGAIGIKEGKIRDIALISRVSKAVCFTVENIITDQNSRPLFILSRRKAQEKCRRDYLDSLTSGDIIDARVTHTEPFGAFCDIGCGIASLIPIDCISVSRIFHPNDRFYIGEDIKAVVKGRDEEGRIHLTHKELLGTWEQNASLIAQGETVSGIVRAVEDYGCFVELFPNLAGLAESKEGVKAGQRASVFIKSIIPEKMKIKLIIIDSFENDYSSKNKKYFVTDKKMTSWRYSPENCEKYMGTDFF